MGILIAITTIGLIAGVGFLYITAKTGSDTVEFITLILGILCSVISAAMFIAILVNIPNWIGASYKAKIINSEYGTNYTREEIFFADDVIETIRQIDRQRIEINGNLMQPKGD